MLGRRRGRDAVLVAGITALAAIPRWPGLATQRGKVFDEVYYVEDALRYLGRADGAEVSWVHPQLGKLLIAWGIELGGDRPAGWRLAVFVAGLATVALTFLVGRRLLGVGGGALAAVFVGLDGLAIVHARTGMLDGLLAPFLLGAVLVLLPVLVPDDDEPDGVAPHDQGWFDRSTLWRLVVAGALLGAAVAIKWSAAPALLAVAVVVAVRLRPRHPVAVTQVAVALAAVPLLVYLATYARFWSTDGLDLGAFVDMHRRMLDYHQTLAVEHPYGSEATSWPLLRRPVSYAFSEEGGQVREVLALGNPALWWSFLAFSPWMAWRWWRDRDPTLELVVAGLVVLYVPWLVTFRQGFLFYLTPLVPFLALGLSWAVLELWATTRPWRWAAPVIPSVVVAVGILYLPLWVGSAISREHWDRLILFDSWI